MQWYPFVVTVIVPAISGMSDINVPEETFSLGYEITVTRQAKPDPPADDDGDDTLWVIARKYGCTVTEIVALNGELITDPQGDYFKTEVAALCCFTSCRYF